MRGIELSGSGAFPRDLLVCAPRRSHARRRLGRDLTRQGIDAGQGNFTSFDTRTELGLSTLRAWVELVDSSRPPTMSSDALRGAARSSVRG